MTASLAAVTVTPGSAAPVPSVTMPRKEPVSTPWANAGSAESRREKTSAHVLESMDFRSFRGEADARRLT